MGGCLQHFKVKMYDHGEGEDKPVEGMEGGSSGRAVCVRKGLLVHVSTAPLSSCSRVHRSR